MTKKKRPNKFSDKEFRKSIYDKTNGRCAYCGDNMHIDGFQIDHIICEYNWGTYLTKGRQHVPLFLEHLNIDDLNHFDNLFASCRSCNGFKDTHPLEGFRHQISMQLERCQRHFNYRLAKRYGLVKETPKPIVFYFETL